MSIDAIRLTYITAQYSAIAEYSLTTQKVQHILQSKPSQQQAAHFGQSNYILHSAQYSAIAEYSLTTQNVEHILQSKLLDYILHSAQYSAAAEYSLTIFCNLHYIVQNFQILHQILQKSGLFLLCKSPLNEFPSLEEVASSVVKGKFMLKFSKMMDISSLVKYLLSMFATAYISKCIQKFYL